MGVCGALYAGCIAVVVLFAPTRGRVLTRAIGPLLTAIGAVAVLTGSIIVLAVGAGVRSPTARER